MKGEEKRAKFPRKNMEIKNTFCQVSQKLFSKIFQIFQKVFFGLNQSESQLKLTRKKCRNVCLSTKCVDSVEFFPFCSFQKFQFYF